MDKTEIDLLKLFSQRMASLHWRKKTNGKVEFGQNKNKVTKKK